MVGGESKAANPGPGFTERPDYRADLVPCLKRVRATFGDEVIVDSTRALVLRETEHVAVYYFPRADVRFEWLVRDISFTIDPSALPSGDTVVRFKFTDLDEFSYWYIKIHDGKTEVCDGVPEGDFDVYITVPLMVFTEIWMGNQGLQSAIDNGDIANWCWVRTYKWSGVSADGLPNLKRWRDAIRERPACQRGLEVPVKLKNMIEDEKAGKEFVSNAEKQLQR